MPAGEPPPATAAVVLSWEQALACHRAGRPEEAAALCRQLLARPELAFPRFDALNLLGALALRAGRLDEARGSFEAALGLQPDHPATLCNLGETLRRAGEPDRAAGCLRRAVTVAPAFPAAWSNLGLCLGALGRPAEAAEAFAEALRHFPGETAPATLWRRLGGARAEAGDHAGAAEALGRAVARDPELTAARQQLGLALARLGRYPEAVAQLREARTRAPGDPSLRLDLARVLLEAGQPAAALAQVRHAAAGDIAGRWLRARAHLGRGDARAAVRDLESCLEQRPEEPAPWLDLGEAWTLLDEPDRAAACFGRAAALENQPAGAATARLVLWHHAHRRTAEALALVDRALTAAGDLPPAPDLLLAEADVRLQSGGEPGARAAAIERLRTVADAPGPGWSVPQRAKLEFALGRLLDRDGRPEEAFPHFERGHAPFRGLHDPAATAAGFRALADAFGPGTLADRRRGLDPAPEDDGPQPIFIVGMPRSGTSLVEQILAAHPAVRAGGEQPFLARLARRLPPLAGGPWPPAPRLRAWGRKYLRDIRAAARAAPGAAGFVTDKTPNNFLHLGLIALLWPAATVLHCRRDPRDTCLSCYFQDFGDYARDLAHLGAFYRHYESLTAHWRRVLPGARIVDVVYEDLVRDPEPAVRRLLAGCGLPWEAGCLRSEGQNRVVHTASRHQVREAIHDRSVGRWRLYARFLGPLRRALGEG